MDTFLLILCIVTLFLVFAFYISNMSKEPFDSPKSCYDMIMSTYSLDHMDNQYFGVHPNKKKFFYSQLEAVGIDGCHIPYHRFKDFERDLYNKCPGRDSLQGDNENLLEGCTYKFYNEIDPQTGKIKSDFDQVMGKKMDELLGNSTKYGGYYASIVNIPEIPLGEGTPESFKGRQRKRILDGKVDARFDVIIKMNESEAANRSSIMQIGTNMPDPNKYPDIAQFIQDYINYYNRKKQQFDNANTRFAYIKGLKYSKDYKDGYLAVTEHIQKKFYNQYYTLIYKYSFKAYDLLDGDTKHMSDWFTQRFDFEKSKPMANMGSVMSVGNAPLLERFKTVDDVIRDENIHYRNEYHLHFLKLAGVRTSYILEVYNKANKDPLISLEFYSYTRDNEETFHNDWFQKFRLVNSVYTTNKHLFYNQHTCTQFATNCSTYSVCRSGSANAPDAHTMFTIIREDNFNDVCNSQKVYLAVVAPSKNPAFEKSICPWHLWYKGKIIVAPDEPIDITNIPNPNDPSLSVEDFKKKHVGDSMVIWAKCEYYDPFQTMSHIPEMFEVNPHEMRNFLIRGAKRDDETWAKDIYKIMGMNPMSNMDDFKELVKEVNGKDRLDFPTFERLCTKTMSDPQNRKVARTMGCIQNIDGF